MNKTEYMTALEKALKTARVGDVADVLAEYGEHFDLKLRDGYGEEEIAARLASPKEVADQYAGIKIENKASGGVRSILAAGLALADIFIAPFFVLLYAWVISLGGFAVASAGLGLFTATGISLWNIIPKMPYICALLLGLSLLALAVLSVMGTEYCRLYITQLFRIYLRWHKGVLGDAGQASPPLTLHPPIKPKKRRIMRNITLVALVFFALCFIAGLGSMMAAAGSLEPWHVWHWFE